MIDRKQIADGLREIGLSPGSHVLVHSSLSSFGHVDGGAEAVIDALLDAVGPSGTILVPTLTATAQHSSSFPPRFDPVEDECWTGRIPETFRRRPEAVRSLHPTHSVAAIGALAQELTADHIHSMTPCDEVSPYGKLAAREDGYVLLLGAEHQSNTTFHHVEEVAAVSYHMQGAMTVSTVVVDGKETTVHGMLHQWGTPRRFGVMEPVFIERGAQKTGKIGESTVRLVHSRSMTELTLRAIRANERILCRE